MEHISEKVHKGKRPRLLFVLHNFHNRAGTEEHTKLLAKLLSAEFEIGFIFPQDESLIFRLEDTRTENILPGARVGWPITPFNNQTLDSSLKRILQIFSPDLIHIQHTFNWPLGVIERLEEFGKPLIMSFHEYFAITPFFTMQGTEDPLVAITSQYVKSIFRADIRPAIIERQKYLREVFSKLSFKIVPSKSLSSILQVVYPGEYKVIPHGIMPFTMPENRYSGDNIRFGYVGSLLPQKGWRQLVEAWPAVHNKYPDAELHLFGGGEDPAELPAGVYKRGLYNIPDLPRVLSEFNVGVIPSIFAETFSLVLSEMQLAGLPVAASKLGVFKERIVAEETGRLFDPLSSEDIAETLIRFIEDQSWRKWDIPKPRLADEMAADYRKIYQSLL